MQSLALWQILRKKQAKQRYIVQITYKIMINAKKGLHHKPIRV